MLTRSVGASDTDTGENRVNVQINVNMNELLRYTWVELQ